MDVVLYTLAFCDPASITSMAACSKAARELAVDPLLWLPKCLKVRGPFGYGRGTRGLHAS